jgi:hypothetical protein
MDALIEDGQRPKGNDVAGRYAFRFVLINSLN